jgi:glycerol-3-phosphate O-acyltransferase
MFRTVELPLWALVLLVAFAAVTFASHFLFPSVRWFFRRRAEKLVAQLNERLVKPIEPFKLARRNDTIQRLIYDPQVAEAVVEQARAEGIPEEVAFEQARRYAREIVPGFSATLYFGLATRLARWLARALFQVRVFGPGRSLVQADADATVIFVANHRSNMDYVLMTWIAARETALAYAVGEWARRWPLQPLIRAMGGYFIRRKDLTPLYRRVLMRYVQLATAGGVTQGIFPEGRLSMTGKLGEPKLGILSYVLGGFDDAGAGPGPEGRGDGGAAGDGPPGAGQGRDVLFVPVGINYERVLEDRILIRATEAGPRAFRFSVATVLRHVARHVWRRLRGRFNREATAAVAFGPPLSLRAFLAQPRDNPAAELAAELMHRIEGTLPVLPLAVLASILADRPDLPRDELDRAFATRLADWRGTRAPVQMPRARDASPSDGVLRMLVARRAVRLTGTAVEVTDEGRPLIAFYAATLPKVAIPAAVQHDTETEDCGATELQVG